MAQLNLLVIRATDPSSLARFYSLLGLRFVEEKHESGPAHLSCDLGGSVFEIYPLGSKGQPTTGARLGFAVQSLTETLGNLASLSSSQVLQPPYETEWGLTALVLDPEGHKVELRETASV
jgi:lactoylglutathione lyase